MAIKNYTPPKRQIIDNRNPNGGFYEATCDSCGRTYYPKRVTSKYCTPKCSLDHHRKAKAEKLRLGGEIKKEERVPPTMEQMLIRSRMKIDKAEKDYQAFIGTCKAAPDTVHREERELTRLDGIVVKLKKEYEDLYKLYKQQKGI